jgi:hypothetical protein
MSDSVKNSRTIGIFMGGVIKEGEGDFQDMICFGKNCYYMPLGYHLNWGSIMEVGDEMERRIQEGNWGLFEQFFSDEMHGYDNFQKACAERNLDDANKWALFFIEGVNNQDPEHVKQAKEYESK